MKSAARRTWGCRAPGKARHILRFDDQRGHFLARRNTATVERQKRPVLAGQQVDAAVFAIPVDCAVEMADARVIAVALVRVGSLRCALEVEFAIHRQRGVRIGLALRKEGHAALARRQSAFADVIVMCIGERNAKTARNVVSLEMLAINTCEFQETTRGQANTFEIGITLLVLLIDRAGDLRVGRSFCQFRRFRDALAQRADLLFSLRDLLGAARLRSMLGIKPILQSCDLRPQTRHLFHDLRIMDRRSRRCKGRTAGHGAMAMVMRGRSLRCRCSQAAGSASHQ